MKSISGKKTVQVDISNTLLVRNTALNLAGKSIPLIVGVLTIPWIMRGMGVDRFGLLSLSWVILSYFAIFDMGLGRATTKFVAEAFGKNRTNIVPSLVFTAVSSQLIFGMVGAFIFRVISPLLITRVLNIPPSLIQEAKDTFQILAFSIPVVFITSSFAGVLEAAQRFDLVNMVMIPSISLNFLLPLIGVLAGFNLPGIMILLFCSRVAVLLAYLTLALKSISGFRGNIAPKKEAFKLLISFGSWITVSSIVSPVLVYIDRFFIGALITLSAVGYYTAPSEMVQRLLIIPASLVATLFPAFSFLGEVNRERLGVLYSKATKYLLLGLGPIVLFIILYARNILELWLGHEFAPESVLVLQVLTLGVFVNALARVPFSLLQGFGRPDIPAKFHLLELLLYIGIVWFLVAKLGITGAAIAWTLRVTFDAVLLFLSCSFLKIVSRSTLIGNSLRESLLVFPLILGTFIMARILDKKLIYLSIFGAGAIGFFAWATWRYALDAKEKSIVGLTLRRMTSGRKKRIGRRGDDVNI